MKFVKRIGDLEARTCSLDLSGTDLKEAEAFTISIVKWNKDDESCYVVAYFHRSAANEFDLHFVGGRPFDNKINGEIFMGLAKYSYNLLQALNYFNFQ